MWRGTGNTAGSSSQSRDGVSETSETPLFGRFTGGDKRGSGFPHTDNDNHHNSSSSNNNNSSGWGPGDAVFGQRMSFYRAPKKVRPVVEGGPAEDDPSRRPRMLRTKRRKSVTYRIVDRRQDTRADTRGDGSAGLDELHGEYEYYSTEEYDDYDLMPMMSPRKARQMELKECFNKIKSTQEKAINSAMKKTASSSTPGGRRDSAVDMEFGERIADIKFKSALDVIRDRWKEENKIVKAELRREEKELKRNGKGADVATEDEDMALLRRNSGLHRAHSQSHGRDGHSHGHMHGSHGKSSGGRNESSQMAGVSSVVAEHYLTTFDLAIGTKNMRILFWAMLGVIMMMAQIWLAWNEEEKVLEETSLGFTLRMVIVLTSIILVAELYFYYQFQRGVELNSWFVMDNEVWRRHMNKFFVLEAVVLGLHTYPEGGLDLYDDNLGVLMLVRLYLIVRVLRDLSPVYRARYLLATDPFLKKTGVVEFNWLLTLKFLFNDNMWNFVVGAMFTTVIIMAYIIWALERQARPVSRGEFEPETSIYVTVITMTTVGFGDIYPVVGRARVAAGFAAIAGSLVSALLSFAVIESLTETPQEMRVRHRLEIKTTLFKQKHLAAKYIQVMWRYFLERKETPFNTYAWHRMTKRYAKYNFTIKNQLKKYRRSLFAAQDLDDVVIARLEDSFDNHSLFWSKEIARKMGVHNLKKRVPHIAAIDDSLGRVVKNYKRMNRRIDKAMALMDASFKRWERTKERDSQRYGDGSYLDRGSMFDDTSAGFDDDTPDGRDRERDLDNNDNNRNTTDHRNGDDDGDNANDVNDAASNFSGWGGNFFSGWGGGGDDGDGDVDGDRRSHSDAGNEYDQGHDRKNRRNSDDDEIDDGLDNSRRRYSDND